MSYYEESDEENNENNYYGNDDDNYDDNDEDENTERMVPYHNHKQVVKERNEYKVLLNKSKNDQADALSAVDSLKAETTELKAKNTELIVKNQKQTIALECAQLQIDELKKRLAEKEGNENEAKMKADLVQKGIIIGSYKAMIAKRDAKIKTLEEGQNIIRQVREITTTFLEAHGPAPKKVKTTE